ncbi:hypothetical protein G6011_05456 [Alternaria panax]|uniref:Alpha/beta hydrolase fold-3 domain-containing protein n=1 Tax=Alternaria panax TaxID=48097 RepID=A0AAD4FCN8_9PLEO|nr:hypothetical protein G6011_05456 [Alternaria panax]
MALIHFNRPVSPTPDSVMGEVIDNIRENWDIDDAWQALPYGLSYNHAKHAMPWGQPFLILLSELADLTPGRLKEVQEILRERIDRGRKRQGRYSWAMPDDVKAMIELYRRTQEVEESEWDIADDEQEVQEHYTPNNTLRPAWTSNTTRSNIVVSSAGQTPSAVTSIPMVDLTQHPVKGVYALAALGFELVRFPLIIAKFLVFGRQHPSWTLRQAITVHAVFSGLWHVATVQVKTPLPLSPDREKERFVVLKPAQDEAYQGPLRSNKDVVPVEIGATWYPAPLSSGSSKSQVKVILHIHGGAFVTGDGRTAASGAMAKKFLKFTPATHVFCPQYRLSTLPVSETSNPFPAALQDSLTSYLYLLNDLEISPKNIIISGDSAGGNLCIALLRYISEYGSDTGLPAPSSALLWSPWINPADTSASYVHDNRNYATDYLSPPFTSWGTRAYAGEAGEQVLSQPYISLKNQTFKTEAPMWVNAGSGEILYFDIVEWAEKMKEAGNDVQLDIEEHVPHDVIISGDILGFEQEAVNMAKRAAAWLKEQKM